MRCVYCGYADTKVTDSRDADDGIRRRRECLNCGQRFTTMERLASGGLMVVKKDGRREEFSREKVLGGLRRACEKRALPAGTVEAVADAIESTLHARGVPEVPSEEIGELAMMHLRDLDHIAYIRFASVYREFADIQQLREELDEIIERGGPAGPGIDQPFLLPEHELQNLTRGMRAFPPRRRRGRPAGSHSRPKSEAAPVANAEDPDASPKRRKHS
jgi:transcriptional repressor NrdR